MAFIYQIPFFLLKAGITDENMLSLGYFLSVLLIVD